MTPIPISPHITTIGSSTKLIPPDSQMIYHVIIDNASKLSVQTNYVLTAVVAILVAIITALLSWVFQRIRDRNLKEEEKREKLYAPLRMYFSTLRSIDKHFEKIRKAAEASDKEAQRILDYEKRIQEHTKAMDSRIQYLNEAVKKWHECVDKIYAVLQTYPGLIKKAHYKTIDKFIDAYIASHYFENQSNEELKNKYPLKYYFDQENIPKFKEAMHELEKVILGNTQLDQV